MANSSPALARAVTLGAVIATLSCAGQPSASTSTTPSATPGSDPTQASRPASPAIVQTLPMDAASVFTREFQAQATPMFASGNYLGIVELLEQKEKEPGLDSSVAAEMRRLSGTYAQFVGQYQDALEAYATQRPAPVAFDTATFNRMTNDDAVDAIARLAANRQAVFVNEASYMPRHRAFTANLLPKLRALGFSYLAVETLAEADTAINARGYPIRATGFYANDPVFGDLLRTAHKLGFKLVPYEAPAGSADRELGEAQRLAERILRADPKAKIVVQASFDHIDESGTIAGAQPMAVRFREVTSIDPLTVDQTVMTEQADTTYEDSRYLFLMKRVRRQTPFVLKNGDSVWTARPGVHDVTVISPRAVHRGGRPNWIWTMGGGARRAYMASDEACPGTLDCLVSARLAGESDDAIPVDVLRVQFSAPGSKTFALPPGQYVIEAKDAKGAPLSRQTITVSAGR
jgi:hypothetical protein